MSAEEYGHDPSTDSATLRTEVDWTEQGGIDRGRQRLADMQVELEATKALLEAAEDVRQEEITNLAATINAIRAALRVAP